MKRNTIKAAAAALSAVLLASALPFAAAAAEDGSAASALIRGDSNGDGRVTINDATLIQRHLVHLETIPDERLAAADVNGDGFVTVSDATWIQKYLAGYANTCGVGQAISGATDPTEATDPTQATAPTEATNPTQATDPTEPTVTGDEWKENTGTITLSNSGITVTGEGISVSGNVVTITEGGDWEVKGTCDNGMIYVDTGEEKDVNDKVKLRLNGATLTNSNGPAIYYDRCKKAFITIEDGSVNTITDSASYDSAYAEAKAAIHSDDTLEIKGKGTLNVNGKYKHGINSDDDIIIENGVINITSVKDALHANDDITLSGKNIKLTANANGDGMESEGTVNIDKASVGITGSGKGINAAGDITLTSGTYEINTSDDCINGNAAVKILDGSYNLTSADDGITGATVDIANGTFEITSAGKGINGDGDISLTGGTYTVNSTADDCINGNAAVNISDGSYTLTAGDEAVTGDSLNITGGTFGANVSGKGFKATTDLNISGGELTVNSADDSVHSNGNITVSGGTLTLTSGDDGIHADTTLTVKNGTITVTKSYEGLEGNYVVIDGGTISVTASDDGVNAAGGNDQSSMGGRPGQNQFNPRPGSQGSDASITVNGGYLYVIASGDGVDSNGALTFNGGTVIVQGPTRGGNFSVDADGTVGFNGGTVMALCSTSAMWEDINGKSGNSVLNKNIGTVSSNSVITVTDSSGKVLSAIKPKITGSVGIVYYTDRTSSLTSCKAVTNGSYSGTLDSFGYSESGTVSGGSSYTLSQGSSSFNPGGRW